MDDMLRHMGSIDESMMIPDYILLPLLVKTLAHSGTTNVTDLLSTESAPCQTIPCTIDTSCLNKSEEKPELDPMKLRTGAEHVGMKAEKKSGK